MSAYQIAKLMYRLKDDEAAIAAWKADSEAVLAGYDLTADELTAIRAKDIRTLYAMGVHPLLVRPFSVVSGLAPAEYLKAIEGLD